MTPGGLDVQLEYNSATSVRVRWRMAPETNTILKHAESGKGLLTHVELFINQHDYICGQGNTIVIWNAIRYGSYYVSEINFFLPYFIIIYCYDGYVARVRFQENAYLRLSLYCRNFNPGSVINETLAKQI